MCASSFFVMSLIGFFMPFFGQKTEMGEVIYFDSFIMLFGGEYSAVVDGIVYSYSFALNLPFLIILAFDASGILFALSARNSPSRIMGTIIIAVFSLGFFLFSRFILMASNPSLSGNNFAFGFGYLLTILSLLLCIAVAILEYCLCRRYRHKREAFR